MVYIIIKEEIRTNKSTFVLNSILCIELHISFSMFLLGSGHKKTEVSVCSYKVNSQGENSIKYKSMYI